MKKLTKHTSIIFVCIIMLVVNIFSTVGLAASDIYELTFDNLFVF